MKTIKHYILICSVFLFVGACDTDFVEVNTNPYAITDIDPQLLFANAQRVSHNGTWQAENTIVQHFQNAYNSGATLGFNFNADIDGINNPKWNASYPDALKNIEQGLVNLGEGTSRVNLRSMMRIWRASIYMGLVDTYGDVPYAEASKAYISGIFDPAYDDDEAIYDDLYDEITESLAAFSTSADFVSADLFYGTYGSEPAGDASAQVAKWKKLGNSILLRLGMRYTKVDLALAQDIVEEAFSGGVMTSNADNAYLVYDGQLFLNGDNNNLRNFSYFYYAAEPLVDNLKANSDPRGKFILASYDEPADVVASIPTADTDLANQFGVPVGVLSGDIIADPVTYRGSKGGGLNYSQINVSVVAAPTAPGVFVSYSEVALLLAEAAFRGWSVDGVTAQTYYNAGITADMQWYSMYPNTGGGITAGEITTYLAEPGVAYSAPTGLELINTQLWLVHLKNGSEAFANFRRSGFPALTRNTFDNVLVTGSGTLDGFAHRMTYPDREGSANPQSYLEAVTAMGGEDNLTARVFWDN